MKTLNDLPKEKRVDVMFGARIETIVEQGNMSGDGGNIKVTLKRSSSAAEPQVLEADLLLGCDGLHSQVRSLVVDPERLKTYSGKCAIYGYTQQPVTPEQSARWLRKDGAPLITDTTLVSKGNDSLLMSYYEPRHDRLYMAAVMPLEDMGMDGSREGWAVRGTDKVGLKKNIAELYTGGGLDCLNEIVDRCDEWFFFPVYMLPPGGEWVKGRALLLGDAAHGVSFLNLYIMCP